MYKNGVKRILDVLFSFAGLALLLPIFLVVSLLLFIFNGGKVFFFQSRPGRNDIIFKIIKFKTMNDRRDPQENLLPDEQRLTWIGRIVRKTSLDEIPQLLNVFIGDMSLIGPRPLLVQYLPLYTETQKRRHKIRPGITGWAQVNGRNAISWEKKFEYDVWYVDNINFRLDLKIIAATIKKVFISEGITATGQATTIPFSGNSQ